MPVRFVPSKDAAHRLACLSLYRNLLRQCTEFSARTAPGGRSSSQTASSTLQQLVRYCFRRDRKYQNWQQIRDALRFGRGALQLLQNAVSGSKPALEEMTRIVSSVTAMAIHQNETLKHIREERNERRLPPKFAKRKAVQDYLADKTNYQRKPDTVPVLNRPVAYEETVKQHNGRRKVPDLFVTSGFPFLRYTHRQPLSLSRYIKAQIVEHEKLWDRAAADRDMIDLADAEDAWDARIQRDFDLELPDSYDPIRPDPADSWSTVHRFALRENQIKINRLDAKRMSQGEMLWQVRMEEEAMAKEENAARKEARRKKWEARADVESEKDQKETQRVATLFGGVQTYEDEEDDEDYYS